MKSKEEKIEEFKKLFYTDLRASDIKEELNLTQKEYVSLIKIVKKELGLPQNYRRQPHRLGKYTKDSFYILKKSNDTCEIKGYYPTKDIAFSELQSKVNIRNNNDSVYEIQQATDDNLRDLIYKEFFINHENWENIISRLQLPYHAFYRILNSIKKESGGSFDRTSSNTRFVYYYKPTGKFMVRKYINGKFRYFGYYDTVDDAIKVRDYLEGINWDYHYWELNKDIIRREILNL